MSSTENNLFKKIADKFFWGQHPEAALRYLPAVKEIRKAGLEHSKIIEIGSGSTGITPYFRKNIDGLDINFEGPKAKYLNKIRGEAYNLPFKDNSYDVSLSVDVLEHIEPEYLESVLDHLEELTERMIFISINTGPAGKFLDDGRNAHLIQEPVSWWMPKLLARFELNKVQRVSYKEFVFIGDKIKQ